MIVDKHQAKSFVRLQRSKLRSKLCEFYVTSTESKLARTFTDDADIYHGLRMRRESDSPRGIRPGQRDDESRCTFGNMLPV